VTDQGPDLPVTVRAAGLDLSGEWPFGSLQVTAGPSVRPAVDLEVSLSEQRVTLEGPLRIGQADWARLARRVDWLPGRGAVRGQVKVVAPRGSGTEAEWLPDPQAADSELRIREFSWTPIDGGISVEKAAGRVRLMGARIEGELDGRLRMAPTSAGAAPADPLLPAPVPFAVSFRGADLQADPLRVEGFVRSGALGPLNGVMQYAPADGAIDLQLSGEQRVERPLLAGVFEGWSAPWDLDRGRLAIEASLNWPADGGLGGVIEVRLDGAAAHYADYAATGLAGEFAVRIDNAGWRLAPSSARVARLAAGVELTDLAARVRGSGEVLEVDVLTGSLFGGRLSVAPFRYDPIAGTARLNVAVEGVDLAQMLALYGERISGSGLLDGLLPVTLIDGVVTVSGGHLDARPPGGSIRLARELVRGTGQPGLDFALRALGDFNYSDLTASVEYADNGDLALALALKGRNPEVEGGRPIHYNLNIVENVPALLESLTLQKRLVESVERRLQR